MIGAIDTIQSQYSSSPKMIRLVGSMHAQLEPVTDIALFFDKIFDISTAEGWGLDNWGRILGQGRIVELPGVFQFGFDLSGLQPFDQASFTPGDVTRFFTMTDPAYRTYLLLKAWINISDCTIPSLNKFLSIAFKNRGMAYVAETGAMKIEYRFGFLLTPFERLIMASPGIRPTPGCVSSTIVEIP